jgi:hypothetical protein
MPRSSLPVAIEDYQDGDHHFQSFRNDCCPEIYLTAAWHLTGTWFLCFTFCIYSYSNKLHQRHYLLTFIYIYVVLHCGVYLASVYCSLFATGVLWIARHQAHHCREIPCSYSLHQSQVVSHREQWDLSRTLYLWVKITCVDCIHY